MLWADVIIVLAQVIDPTSGVGGWAAFIITTPVLAWLLLIHLPAKDKQMKEFLEAKDRQLLEQSERFDKRTETIAAAYLAEIKDTKVEFKEALNAVLVHCEKDMGELIAVFRTEVAKFGEKR